MNVKIYSDFQFKVVSIKYTPNGELCISLTSDNFSDNSQFLLIATTD